MILNQLIYVSDRNKCENDIKSIQTEAQYFNKINNLTGALLYTDISYLQVLEGSRKDLTLIFNKIMKDARHKNIRLIQCGDIVYRNFYNWSMLFLNANKINEQILFKHGIDKDLDVVIQSDSISSEKICSLFLELIKRHEIYEALDR